MNAILGWQRTVLIEPLQAPKHISTVLDMHGFSYECICQEWGGQEDRFAKLLPVLEINSVK